MPTDTTPAARLVANVAVPANDVRPARLTLTERAAVIRAALRAAGLSARDISVTSSASGCSVNVRVKAAIGLARVRSIVEGCKVEEIHRDHMTGETLLGGTYVMVDRAYDSAANSLRESVTLAIRAAIANGNSHAEFGGMVAFHEGRCDWKWTIVLPDGETLHAYGLETCARNMVEAWLDAQDAQAAAVVS